MTTVSSASNRSYMESRWMVFAACFGPRHPKTRVLCLRAHLWRGRTAPIRRGRGTEGGGCPSDPSREGERSGTANNRSFLSFLPLLICLTSRMPTGRHRNTTPRIGLRVVDHQEKYEGVAVLRRFTGRALSLGLRRLPLSPATSRSSTVLRLTSSRFPAASSFR